MGDYIYTPTAIEIGIDGTQNSRCNTYGFGGVHVKYMGDYSKYVSDAASTLSSEIATAKAALDKYASAMSDSVEYKALNNAVLAATSALDGTTLAYPISSTIKAPFMQTYVGWVEPTESEAKGVYNIAGQKVADNADNLPAGLYIVNGKKIVIR